MARDESCSFDGASPLAATKDHDDGDENDESDDDDGDDDADSEAIVC